MIIIMHSMLVTKNNYNTTIANLDIIISAIISSLLQVSITHNNTDVIISI